MLRTRELPPRLALSRTCLTCSLSDIDLAPVEDRIKPILHYARKLTSSPARMTEAMRLPSMKLGGETTHHRLVDGVGLALPEGYVAEAAQRLSTQGYDVFAQLAKA